MIQSAAVFEVQKIFQVTKSDSSKFTSLQPFIIQILVVAQLDSLIWVEVLFMVETMNQVSSTLEFS
jgi:hypothetical protein